jgi:hypothetical protein
VRVGARLPFCWWHSLKSQNLTIHFATVNRFGCRDQTSNLNPYCQRTLGDISIFWNCEKLVRQSEYLDYSSMSVNICVDGPRSSAHDALTNFIRQFRKTVAKKNVTQMGNRFFGQLTVFDFRSILVPFGLDLPIVIDR